MSLCCQHDERRDLVRRTTGRTGLDYVEVRDERTLHVYFLGKLPPELVENRPGIERYLGVEGGRRVADIRVVDVDPVVEPDPTKDDLLVVRLDRSGDFSTYAVRLRDVEGLDPRYDRAEFSFKLDCPSDLDCAPACACEPPDLPEPEINYLAKDYASFKQLVYDRLALLAPGWTERHAPDLGVALVELLAYVGDYLSYYQDAVATEAYLGTARRRISVRRHARLVDYALHEGCNARAWVSVETSADLELDPKAVAFVTGVDDALAARRTVLTWEDLRDESPGGYEVFEPLVADRCEPIRLRAAHGEIRFHTWGDRECCVERGSTSATLRDAWVGSGDARALDLRAGDVVIFEEVLGPVTGLPGDADPARRHAVRLTKVERGEDPLVRTEDDRPLPYLGIEWSREDALPFTLCLSAIGAAPDCRYLENVSVARGNVVLVDHGRTVGPDDLGEVSTLRSESSCECAGRPGDVRVTPARFRVKLERTPLTFRAPLPAGRPGASALLAQDVRAALPEVALATEPAEPWAARYDLLASGPSDRHFVVEIDDDGVARLRFGDGEMGYRPPAGMRFTATYRVGTGPSGNVGPESISRLVVANATFDGVSIAVRNPLPASGGTAPEPIAEAKLFAPSLFRTRLERAVTAEDYERIAERDGRLQNASAALVWTGSWYEADVAIDPAGIDQPDPALMDEVRACLERFRRMGHDLAVRPARYVPLRIALEVCALPHFQRGHVKAALLDAFSTRALTGGRRGFFHPDNLTFGEGIYLSRIVAAAQAVPGVECVTVTELHRLFEAPNRELETGVLPLGGWEIARLDNDPSFPEHGMLEIHVNGGR